MYKPVPPRPKKTHICRSRTGCSSCRQRRKKCDERKPSCSSCVKLGRRCEPVSPTFEFRSVEIRPSEDEKQPLESPLVTDDTLNRQRTSSCRKTVPTNTTQSLCSLESLAAGSPSEFGRNLDTDLIWEVDAECGQNFDSLPRKLVLLDSSFRRTQLELDHMNKTGTPIAPALVSLHNNYSNAITFYMKIWRNHCLPALHLSFHHIEAIWGHSRLIIDTMATLSACRLSRTLPQRRLVNTSKAPSLCFRPDAGHECLSGELYGSALRQMSLFGHKELDSRPTVALTVLVLFCYLESSMGNFKEFQIHSKALEKLLSSYSDRFIFSNPGLLAAWVEVKMQNWWRRAHFGVPDFYRDWSTPLVDPIFKNMSTTFAYRRASVLWTLCESHRLSTAAIIASFEKYHNDQTMQSDQVSLLESVSSTATEHKPSGKELVALMRAQSEELDQWHASLQDHELPEIKEGQSLWDAAGMQKPEDAVIHFKSHILAMNFAYYVTARVMQCTGPLQALGSNSLVDIINPYGELEAWIQILLRIAAGVNWNDCIRLNVYTIGFAGLLLACALRSRKLATGLWIQTWLEERLAKNGFEEGNFPVFQILDAVKVINHERSNGRDVISLFQTVDDGGGSGKFGSYSSQIIQSFLVYARCNETGNLYSYQVSPGDLGPLSESH